MDKLLFQTEIGQNKKKIRIFNSDLTLCNKEYDIVICSAFKDDYYPVADTLIGALKYNRNIDLYDLSKNPEINFKDYGGWLSRKIDNNIFKRIACIEIFSIIDVYLNNGIGPNNRLNHNILKTDKLLSQTFSTMSYIIKQAAFKNIDIKRIALPLLGAGNQGIELEYVIPPLLTECITLLRDIDSLEEIDFYEINFDRALKFSSLIQQTLMPINKPDVFISYSTKNENIALEIAQILKDNNISYWMAPESIPPTSDYINEITNAIMSVSILLVVLTTEAEGSAWVPLEVSSAKGAKKILLGYKPIEYEIHPNFNFLFQRSQIYSAYNDPDYKKNLVMIINRELNKL